MTLKSSYGMKQSLAINDLSSPGEFTVDGRTEKNVLVSWQGVLKVPCYIGEVPSVTSPAHFLIKVKNKTVPVSSPGPLAPFLSIFFFRSGPTAKPEDGQVGGFLPQTHARLPYFP